MHLFIDTNVFLSFFHLSNDDLEEIHKLAVLIDNGDIRLWLTEQVHDEFNRNREAKLSDSLKKLKEQQTKGQFPQICKDYEEYPEIRKLQSDFDKKISILMEKVRIDVESRNLKADEKIRELFQKSEFVETTSALISKARLRMDIRNPPGKDGSLGDAINWEALLENVPNNEKLYLVADDKDYYSVLDNTKPKDFLIDEWKDKKNEDLVFYRRLSQFFKDHYPDIKLASELEKEIIIKELVTSMNFFNTHVAIKKLQEYSDFNRIQINELIQACLTNDQIGWILSDQDVFTFFQNLFENHHDLLEEDLRNQISIRLQEIERSKNNIE